jgi:hypothetical protein
MEDTPTPERICSRPRVRSIHEKCGVAQGILVRPKDAWDSCVKSRLPKHLGYKKVEVVRFAFIIIMFFCAGGADPPRAGSYGELVSGMQ